MRSKPKSFLGRIQPGKWFFNGPHWPGGGARLLGGRTAPTGQGSFGETHRPTGPQGYSLNLATQVPCLRPPPRHLSKPFLRCNNSSATRFSPRAVSTRLNGLPEQNTTSDSSSSLFLQQILGRSWLVKHTNGTLWFHCSTSLLSLPSSLMYREANVSERPLAKWLTERPIYQVPGERAQNKNRIRLLPATNMQPGRTLTVFIILGPHQKGRVQTILPAQCFGVIWKCTFLSVFRNFHPGLSGRVPWKMRSWRVS